MPLLSECFRPSRGHEQWDLEQWDLEQWDLEQWDLELKSVEKDGQVAKVPVEHLFKVGSLKDNPDARREGALLQVNQGLGVHWFMKTDRRYSRVCHRETKSTLLAKFWH